MIDSPHERIELLIIESNGAAARVLAEALKAAGPKHVNVAVIGEDALPEVLREIRRNPDLEHNPVVVLSASQNLEVVKQARALGASCFLAKPREMIQCVRLCEFALNSGFGLGASQTATA